MTSFSFTTGNPNNLTAGANASMADIQGPFTDLRTFLNGGTMDETNVPNLAAAFTKYTRVAMGRTELTNPTGTLLLQLGYTAVAGIAPGSGNATVSNHAMYLDPTIYTANLRVTKLNLRASIIVNAVAPAVNYSIGLYPVNTWGGASGGTPIINTVGTVVSGSTAGINAPSATAAATQVSGDFNFPSAGWYAFGVVPSGAATVNSVVAVLANLDMRQV